MRAYGHVSINPIWVYTHMSIYPKYTHVHTLWVLSFLVVFHLNIKCKTGAVVGQLGGGQSTLWGQLATYHPAEGSNA